jgi:hypothetical protein
MATDKGKEFLKALEIARQREDRATGTRRTDKQVETQLRKEFNKQVSAQRNPEGSASKATARSSAKPAPAKRKPSPAASSKPSPGKAGSGSSTTPKKRSTASSPEVTRQRSGGGVSRRDIAGVAGAAAAAGAVVGGAKAVSGARTSAATTQPGYNARGGASSTGRGYVKRPQRSGFAGRASENWGRGVRTGAAGSKEFGRPSSTATQQTTRPQTAYESVSGKYDYRQRTTQTTRATSRAAAQKRMRSAGARDAAQQRKTGRNPTVKGRAVRSGYGTGVGRYSMRKPG